MQDQGNLSINYVVVKRFVNSFSTKSILHINMMEQTLIVNLQSYLGISKILEVNCIHISNSTLISLITVEVGINVEGGKSFKINKRGGVKPI